MPECVQVKLGAVSAIVGALLALVVNPVGAAKSGRVHAARS
jgi:hypothetical protein